MVRKQIVKALDGISTAYLRTQKRGRKDFHFTEGLEELLSGKTLTDPYKYFANAGVVPEPAFTKSVQRIGYELKYFKFRSLIESPHEVNNTVHGRLYEINGNPGAPTVVLLHGWRMGSYHFFDYYCRLLVRAGFNAVLVDMPYHMKRRVPHSFHGEFTVNEDVALTFLVVRQSVVDVQCAINWIKSRGAPLVGVVGMSLGGMLTGLVGCVEPAVDFMMLIAPPVDMYDFFTQSPLGNLLQDQNPKLFEEIDLYKDAFDKISLLNLKPQMPPAKIFLAKAEYDGMVNPEKLEELWHKWERPYMERYRHGHLSVLLLNPEMNRDMRIWLKTIYEPKEQ